MDNEQSCKNNVVIDWELSMKLAGDKRDLASELLVVFLKSLITDVQEICKLKSENNIPELLKHLHKLHGATCYVGLPRLKKTICTLETALKQGDINDFKQHFSDFEFEVQQVLEQAPKVLE